MDERKGSALFGLPAMIGLFAFIAFVGVIGIVGAIIAIVVFLLIIGAVVSTGKRRPNP